MKKLLYIFALLFAFGWMGCQNASNTVAKQNVKPLTQKQLITFNRKLLRQEKREIDTFVKTKHWKVKESGTGLRYQILVKGKGTKAHTGQIVKIRYSVELLDGQKVYSGIKSFKIGYGRVENGLEEGILLLKKGDEARFILPSHLAYGLSGDGNKIPPHTPIIYYVELLELK
jgi:FKBP-type peptidyl-prolyl cis-trans isomerase